MVSSWKRVLVVEDDPLLRRAYLRLLSTGFEIVSVSTATEALHELSQGRFGAIVSDIDMPGPSGIELLKTLRASTSEIPVVLVTGSPSMESAQDAVNFGAFRYLTKPVGVDALRDAVTRATRISRLAELRAMSHEASREDAWGVTRAAAEQRFERALDGLWIAFQPIVSWKRCSVAGYEALLRTTEPSLESPVDFLRAAEALDRVEELSHRVWRAIGDALPDAPPDVRIFVNLHASDLSSSELLLDPEGPLTKHAHRIVLEVTERASLEDLGESSRVTTALREMGYALAIDDLGAGYASLSSLTMLDPEVVKLDMSLVRGIDAHHVKRQLVQSMLTVCADLGMDVVVEGVETIAERDALVRLGCDLMQGFLFARPAPGFADVCSGASQGAADV